MLRAMAATSRVSTIMIKMLSPATPPPDIPLPLFTGDAGATSGFTLTASDKSATAVCNDSNKII